MTTKIELEVTEIPEGEGRTFSIEGRSIAVFRPRGGGVYATQAACPHRGGPLADGLVGPRSVICPLHDLQFDLETGETASGACQLTTYPAREEHGSIIVELPD